MQRLNPLIGIPRFAAPLKRGTRFISAAQIQQQTTVLGMTLE